MSAVSDICVIPAKARSTRLPGKNMALLAGRPMMCWSIAAARECRLFEVVLVSTDDPEIARTAEEHGAEAPFLRDESLTRDKVEVMEVVRHALQWYQEHRQKQFAWVCVLQPTSPLRTAQHVLDSRKLIDEHPSAHAVISVTRYHHHPGWALRVENGKVVPNQPATASASRQDLPVLYHPDGLIYWQRADLASRGEPTYAGEILPYFTPPHVGLDIDYPEDLELAEWLMSRSIR